MQFPQSSNKKSRIYGLIVWHQSNEKFGLKTCKSVQKLGLTPLVRKCLFTL